VDCLQGKQCMLIGQLGWFSVFKLEYETLNSELCSLSRGGVCASRHLGRWAQRARCPRPTRLKLDRQTCLSVSALSYDTNRTYQ